MRCHQMRAGAAFDFGKTLQQLGTDCTPLGGLVGSAFEAFDNTVGYVYAEQVIVHPARRFGRPERSDADQEMRLFGKTAVDQCGAVAPNLFEFETVLGLEKLGAVVYLGLQARRRPFIAWFRRHFRSTEKQRWWRLDWPARGELAQVAHVPHLAHHLAQRAAERLGLLGPGAAPALDALETAVADDHEPVSLNAAYALGGAGEDGVAAFMGDLDRLYEHLAEPKRAVDCFGPLFNREIDENSIQLAIGETLAHLNCLMGRRLVQRERDAQGVDWYSQKTDIFEDESWT